VDSCKARGFVLSDTPSHAKGCYPDARNSFHRIGVRCAYPRHTPLLFDSHEQKLLMGTRQGKMILMIHLSPFLPLAGSAMLPSPAGVCTPHGCHSELPTHNAPNLLHCQHSFRLRNLRRSSRQRTPCRLSISSSRPCTPWFGKPVVPTTRGFAISTTRCRPFRVVDVTSLAPTARTAGSLVSSRLSRVATSVMMSTSFDSLPTDSVLRMRKLALLDFAAQLDMVL